MTNSPIKYKLIPTTRYKRQLRKIAKSGKITKSDLNELNLVLDQLAMKIKITEKYRDHPLGKVDSHADLFG